ncbi:MAG: AEC family transporter [Spirochaetes bacterium]|nr:AEC family transporter [Spirochaetota bacterium]
MTVLVHIVEILFPLVVTIAAGYALGKVFDLSEDTLVRVLTDFVAPLLIFVSLYRSNLTGESVLRIGGASFFVIGSIGLVAYAWASVSKLDRRAYLPPILFYNTGFLGIPLMYLWGGTEALNVIVIYDQMQGIAIFTLGIFLVTGGFSSKGMLDVLKSPLLWGMVLGFFFRFAGIKIPNLLLHTAEFGGAGMASLAAFSLGVALRNQRISFDRHLWGGLFLRVVGGFLLGVLGARFFGLTHQVGIVFIVGSALPSAVFSYIITHRYGADASFSGTMILVSTLFGVVTIPLTFWAANFFL